MSTVTNRGHAYSYKNPPTTTVKAAISVDVRATAERVHCARRVRVRVRASPPSEVWLCCLFRTSRIHHMTDLFRVRVRIRVRELQLFDQDEAATSEELG